MTLFTHLVVREDAHLLFGFGSDTERRAFRQLLKISGIGAQDRAFGAVGPVRSRARRRRSRCRNRAPHRCPGIGKKTAERLLLELKDKLGADVTQRSASTGAPRGHLGHHECAAGARLQRARSAAAVKQLPRRRGRRRRHQAGADGARQGHESRCQTTERDRLIAARRRAAGRGARARAAPAPPRRIHRPGEDPRPARNLHRGGEATQRSARSRAAVRPARPRQDDAVAHHRARARREPAPDVRTGARARRAISRRC